MRHQEDPSPDDPSQSWFLVGQSLRRYEVRFWDSGETGTGLEGSYQLRVDGVVATIGSVSGSVMIDDLIIVETP